MSEKINRVALLGETGTTIVPFNLGEKVKMDGEVTGTVIGIAIYPTGIQFHVSWWNAGAVLERWFAEWRIEQAP